MNIVVTGASRGIGYATVKTLATEGHSVVGTARSEDLLNTLEQEVPHKINTFVADLTDDESVDQLSSHISSTFAKVDVLVNNAGGLINKPFEELTMDEWQNMIEVNLLSAVRLTKAMLPQFDAGSHIINISSMGGYQESAKFPGLSAYSVAKGALTTLSECLTVELADRGITVNALCLGAVETEMFNAAFPDFDAPVTAEQMGNYLADFAVNGSTFYNGKVLPVSLADPG
ncbi:SDR family oxidoreductase [Aliifodinibius sp. S!AR15-10]|uniref:SDR family NAD(P)-dependent oxidoreductase n=1 Tax=Aliifodinibius sp. S!AR15-10 TaxID=2950437 RepID=UPI0028555731|nr:SDR family oxidoreductase [Aliifodinibius sp. S!AR15-10]MDR8393320.1 SDR family oxidoreductase [Aliifodinibius sp. S!AR15-10]